MPRMDIAPPENQLVKLLIIGDGKIGKTHYAGAAAEHFNVLYFDGDVATQTIATLPTEAKRNIYLIASGDTISGGQRDHRFVDLFSEFSSRIKFKWNDTESKLASVRDFGKEVWEIQPSKMNHNDIFVLDSWTSLVESIMLKCAFQCGVDLSNATTSQMRPVYQSAGLMATSFLQVIRSMPCHVIVIAHPDEFTHQTKPEGRRVSDVKETDMVIDWTKMIPKSTSKPQGLQMPKYFTDVAWAEIAPNGRERRLNFKTKNDRVSGGHFDDSKDMTKDYTFAKLVERVGGVVPKTPLDPMGRWLNIIPAGENVKPESKVLDGTESKPVKGLAGLTK